MTAEQVPAGLLHFVSDLPRRLDFEAWLLDNSVGDSLRRIANQLRALLPQPEPTCPNCGHRDGLHHSGREHDGYGIQGCDEDGCDCALTPAALPQVRALLAAERDAKPASRKPRVWNVGDPEPDDRPDVRDCERDIWTHWRGGVWGCRTHATADDRRWEAILNGFAPLTEVLPGGDR